MYRVTGPVGVIRNNAIIAGGTPLLIQDDELQSFKALGFIVLETVTPISGGELTPPEGVNEAKNEATMGKSEIPSQASKEINPEEGLPVAEEPKTLSGGAEAPAATMGSALGVAKTVTKVTTTAKK